MQRYESNARYISAKSTETVCISLSINSLMNHPVLSFLSGVDQYVLSKITISKILFINKTQKSVDLKDILTYIPQHCHNILHQQHHTVVLVYTN